MKYKISLGQEQKGFIHLKVLKSNAFYRQYDLNEQCQ